MSDPTPIESEPSTQQSSATAESLPDPTSNTANDGGTTTSASHTTTTKRITANAKKELFDFFKRSNWTRNKKMPRENGNAALDDIIKKHGLKREQAARQLRAWKLQEFGHSLVKILISKEELEETIYEFISVPLNEYVTNFLKDLYEGNDIAGCQDTTNQCQSLKYHHFADENKRIIKYIHDNPGHECNKILVALVKKFTSAMAEYFPKTASKLSDAEMQFALAIRYDKEQSVKKWMSAKFGTLPDDYFGHLGMFVFDCLYSVWCLSSVENDRPDIEIPEIDLVGKYSRPIIYYVSGWTLQRATLALTESVDDRKKYANFATKHSIGLEGAKEALLPFDLVERRQKRSLLFCSKEYYVFICVVESTYIQNLTLKMMLAYADGDLVNAIHKALYASEKIRSMFFGLNGASGDVDEDERESQLEILKFILDRYVRMRGCWFVKSLKSTQGKSLDDRKLEAAPTTMKVAHGAAKTKAAAEARAEAQAAAAEASERQLWATVEESVMEYEDEEDRIEDNDDMEAIAMNMQYEESDEE